MGKRCYKRTRSSGFYVCWIVLFCLFCLLFVGLAGKTPAFTVESLGSDRFQVKKSAWFWYYGRYHE